MQIKPSITYFSKILSGEETKYRIPKYQRDYSWKYNEEVDELWRDIMFSFKDSNDYFIGNIVLNANGDIDTATEFDIVDGQQRITTFSILFKIIKDYCDYFIRNKGDKFFKEWDYTKDYSLVMKIMQRANDRLVYYGEPDNYYLELNDKDQPIFRKEILENNQVLKEEEEFQIIPNESRIIKTKKFFALKIVEEFINVKNGVKNLEKFITHLNSKLKINSIKVGEDYDAYLLFESLNSKGMNLSQTDLIKNKMLMQCSNSDSDQKITFENWNEIISNINFSQNKNAVDFFYYNWLTFENISAITKKTLYKSVRSKLLPLNSNEVVKYTNELINISKSYSDITNDNLIYPSNTYKSESLQQYLSEIQQLNYSICLPTILYAYHNSFKHILELAKYSVSFLFRTITIGELQVRKAKDTFDDILEILKSNPENFESIKRKFEQDLQIDNEEFKLKFKQKTFSNNISKYVLTKILQYDLGSESMIYEVDLEHILPQSHEKYWCDFNFDKRKPEDVINNIGNLTLLNPGNNRKVQNKCFDKKISTYKKRISNNDKESTTISLTYKINEDFMEAIKHKEYPKNSFWTTQRIDSRADNLSKNISEIWKI